MPTLQPRDLLLISTDYNEMSYALTQGYRVLVLTEDPMFQEFMVHPNVMKMSILLPPFQAANYEVEGNIQAALFEYKNHVMAYPPAVSMMRIIYVAALGNTKMALCIGSESTSLRLMANPDEIFSLYGIHFGRAGDGYIDLDFAPLTIYRMYMEGEIPGMQALALWPPMAAISPDMAAKLTMELNPPGIGQNPMAAQEYFMTMANSLNGSTTNQYGHRYFCPFKDGGV